MIACTGRMWSQARRHERADIRRIERGVYGAKALRSMASGRDVVAKVAAFALKKTAKPARASKSSPRRRRR